MSQPYPQSRATDLLERDRTSGQGKQGDTAVL